MTHPKIRKPKKDKTPPVTMPMQELSADPDVLSKEFQILDKQLATINANIQKSVDAIQNHQEIIKSVRAEGQVILGKLDMLARILSGMGIDPRSLVAQTPPAPPEIPEKEPIFSEEKAENTPQVVENKEDPRLAAIKQRFNR